MDFRDAHDRIVATLREEFRSTGRGSITAAEIELGLYPGFYRKSRRAQNLRLIVLAATLEHLEVDPGVFFAKAFAVSELKEKAAADRGSCSDRPKPAPGYRPPDSEIAAAREFFRGTAPERRS